MKLTIFSLSTGSFYKAGTGKDQQETARINRRNVEERAKIVTSINSSLKYGKGTNQISAIFDVNHEAEKEVLSLKRNNAVKSVEYWLLLSRKLKHIDADRSKTYKNIARAMIMKKKNDEINAKKEWYNGDLLTCLNKQFIYYQHVLRVGLIDAPRCLYDVIDIVHILNVDVRL